MEIVYHPHPDLRKHADPILEIDDEIRARALEMVELMIEARGVGLAANQVAWRQRLVVVCPSGERGGERILVNPEVLEAEGEALGEEGCLSFPRIYGQVVRAERIRYRYQDLDGQRVERTAEDLEARIVQHEIDHLDGIVFTMRMTPADRLATRRALKELERRFKERQARGSVL